MGRLVTIALAVLVVLLVWGFLGGQKANDTGITCDFGLGKDDSLCWNWHKNVVGEIQEGLKETGSAIKTFFEDNS